MERRDGSRVDVDQPAARAVAADALATYPVSAKAPVDKSL
jgi:hypothetical protein